MYIIFTAPEEITIKGFLESQGAPANFNPEIVKKMIEYCRAIETIRFIEDSGDKKTGVENMIFTQFRLKEEKKLTDFPGLDDGPDYSPECSFLVSGQQEGSFCKLQISFAITVKKI